MSILILHGRVLTKARLDMIAAYERRTWRFTEYNCRLSRRQYEAACAWRKGFAKFMCKGWDGELQTYGHADTQQDAQQHDPDVHARQAQLDSPGPTEHERA